MFKNALWGQSVIIFGTFGIELLCVALRVVFMTLLGLVWSFCDLINFTIVTLYGLFSWLEIQINLTLLLWK